MLNNPYRRSPTERHWDQICIGFFFKNPARSTKAAHPQDSGSSGLKSQERKPVDHPDGRGARRSLPTKPLPPGSGGILNRDSEPGSGNNSTLDNLFLHRFLGPNSKE